MKQLALRSGHIYLSRKPAFLSAGLITPFTLNVKFDETEMDGEDAEEPMGTLGFFLNWEQRMDCGIADQTLPPAGGEFRFH